MLAALGDLRKSLLLSACITVFDGCSIHATRDEESSSSGALGLESKTLGIIVSQTASSEALSISSSRDVIASSKTKGISDADLDRVAEHYLTGTKLTRRDSSFQERSQTTCLKPPCIRAALPAEAMKPGDVAFSKGGWLDGLVGHVINWDLSHAMIVSDMMVPDEVGSANAKLGLTVKMTDAVPAGLRSLFWWNSMQGSDRIRVYRPLCVDLNVGCPNPALKRTNGTVDPDKVHLFLKEMQTFLDKQVGKPYNKNVFYSKAPESLYTHHTLLSSIVSLPPKVQEAAIAKEEETYICSALVAQAMRVGKLLCTYADDMDLRAITPRQLDQNLLNGMSPKQVGYFGYFEGWGSEASEIKASARLLYDQAENQQIPWHQTDELALLWQVRAEKVFCMTEEQAGKIAPTVINQGLDEANKELQIQKAPFLSKGAKVKAYHAKPWPPRPTEYNTEKPRWWETYTHAQWRMIILHMVSIVAGSEKDGLCQPASTPFLLIFGDNVKEPQLDWLEI